MTHAPYVFAGYAASAAVLAAYAGWVVTRSRALARQIAPPSGADDGSGADAPSGP
ncbi:MAG: heme exporter protein CcmD [Actinobacteria bacterium]|nr:heme exporter protein CcmD [Actinomycetota bacterium]